MYMQVIVTACLVSVVVMSVVLTTQAYKMKKNYDDKLRNVVDQINTSQFYQYELEKRSYDKLNNVDTNINNVRTNYMTKNDFKERVVSNTLDIKDINQHDGTVSIGGKIDFGNSMSLSPKDKELSLNLPAGTYMNIKDGSGQSIASYNNLGANAPYQRADKLQIGDKWQLSGVGDAQGNDGWLRLFDKAGKDYYGGLAAGSIMTKDGSSLGGNTEIDSANVKTLNIRGAASEHNPENKQTELPSKDKINYVRGDTQVDGNLVNVGDVTVGRNLDVKGLAKTGKVTSTNVKIGHNWGGWADEAPITAYTTGMGASFGNEYWSHFPKNESTYIRPGKTGGSIFIGDIGNTSSIEMGDKNTVTRLQGQLCLQDTCISRTDLDAIKKLSSK
jgi:hypothetical protein